MRLQAKRKGGGQMRDERLLSVQEVAELYGVPRSWVYTQAEAGRLPHFKIGRYVRFKREDIADWLAGQRREPQPAGR
jgi:excisionase family DNA binding protein